MKMTRPGILVILIAWYAVGVDTFGVVETAAYTFLFLALWLIYKYWDHKLPRG
jgi:hypothetical protein